VTEEWRRIPSFPDYEVSSDGKIRRFRDGHSYPKGYVLKQRLNSMGYFCVMPCLYGVPKAARVHRLVAEAFLGPCPEGHVVNHRDGNRQNNSITNLEYCTRSQDIAHAYAIGHNRPRQGLTPDQVFEIRRLCLEGVPQSEVGRRFQVPQRTVSAIVCGRNYRSLQEQAGLSFGTTEEERLAAHRQANWMPYECPTCGRIIHGAGNFSQHRAGHDGTKRPRNLSDEERAARAERMRQVRTMRGKK
jgi:hypothetical protein